jgi:ABC-type polysaccharide/polyol phosphate transport system ATPase subunit
MTSTHNVITIKNLVKSYKLYSKPVDRLKEAIHPFGKIYHREFHALKNISLNIASGETVGIIGKNGSGKSTLLKLITGILSPTAGSIETKGKIAALLELGAGFNPELSGYENIYLNGAIMGYSRSEIDSKVQSILDFADIGEFADQPVRKYSSGMFVRLAFSVAINTDPDILIVDEALSVGDLKFQQKCYRAIKNFITNKKTVLFVGHDLSAMTAFCTRCIWLDGGVVRKDGDPAEVTRDYASFMSYGDEPSAKKESKVNPSAENHEKKEWISTHGMESFGNKNAWYEKILVLADGQSKSKIIGGERIEIFLSIRSNKVIEHPIIGFELKNRLGLTVLSGNTYVHNVNVSPVNIGVNSFKISFTFPFLANGEYIINVALADGTQDAHTQEHWVHDCFIFKISNPQLRFSSGNGIVLENNFHFLKLESSQ